MNIDKLFSLTIFHETDHLIKVFFEKKIKEYSKAKDVFLLSFELLIKNCLSDAKINGPNK